MAGGGKRQESKHTVYMRLFSLAIYIYLQFSTPFNQTHSRLALSVSDKVVVIMMIMITVMIIHILLCVEPVELSSVIKRCFVCFRSRQDLTGVGLVSAFLFVYFWNFSKTNRLISKLK